MLHRICHLSLILTLIYFKDLKLMIFGLRAKFLKYNIIIYNIIFVIISLLADFRNTVRRIFKLENDLKKADLQIKAFFTNMKTTIFLLKCFKAKVVFN